MSETVEIIINAKDNASGTLGGISGGIKSLGNMAATVAKAGLAVFAAGVAAVGTGLAYSLKQAMEAQEGLAQLDAVLKSTGGAAGVTRDMALELADSLSAVTRFSDDSVLAAENLLLTFTNIGEDVFPRATETLLDMATAMGTDAESGAIQLGKALNDPIAGITALSRVGVTFTDEQKKAIEAMVEMGDVAGAQTIILDELAKEFGGSAEAAGQTFAGQLDILKNSLDNVAEGVGMALLPILQDLTGFVTENVLPWVVGIGEEFSRLLGIFQETGWENFFVTFEDGSSYVGSFFEKLGFGEETANAIGAAINTLAQWLGENLPIAMQFVSDFWTNTLQPALLDLWNWLSINVPLAIQTLSSFWTETLLPAITTVYEWISSELIPLFSEIFRVLQDELGPATGTLASFWTDTLQPALVAVWGWMQESLLPLLGDLWTFIKDNLPTAIGVLANFWTTTLLPAILSVYTWIIGSLFPTLSTLWTWLSTTLTAALQTLSDYWTTTLKPALDIVWGFVNDSVIPLFEKLGELFSVTLLAAVTLLTDYWTGTLKPALDDVWAFIKDFLQPVFDNLAAFFEETIVPAITGAMPTLESLQNFFDGLKTTVSGLISFVQTLINKILAIPGIPGGDNTGGGTGGETNINNQTADGFQPVTNKPATVADLLAQGDLLGAMELARDGQVSKKSRSPLGGGRDGKTRSPLGGNAPMKGGDSFAMVGSEAGGGNIIYQLIIYSQAKTENLIDDFNMLKEAAALG